MLSFYITIYICLKFKAIFMGINANYFYRDFTNYSNYINISAWLSFSESKVEDDTPTIIFPWSGW